MIITERFVMLHFSKTGSSFARKTIEQLYAKYDAFPYKSLMKLGVVPSRSMLEVFIPGASRDPSKKNISKHGTYIHIPPEHRHKKIVTITRNPFDRYVSAYLFGWWKNYQWASPEEVRAVWPHFPNLSFAEYYEMLHHFARKRRLNGVQPKIDLGLHTIQFIRFYFPDPDRVLGIIDDDYIQRKKYLDDMVDVTFLHQENLNCELYDFLLGLGYPRKELEFIKHAEKQNVTPRSDDQKKRSDFFTPELVEQIYARDRLLFEIFPEYKQPAI